MFLHALVNGGEPPYRFLWSGGGATVDVVHATAGVYTVMVTDNRNNSVTTIG